MIHMIWDERHLGPVWTHIEALGRVFGRFFLLGAYACCVMITEIQIWDTGRYWNTNDTYDTYEIQTFGARLIHIEALGRVLGRFCPLGTRLCMHRYDEIWDGISLSIRVAPGRDVTQIVRHCPSVEVRIWRDYFPRYLFGDDFQICEFYMILWYDFHG